MRKEFRIKDYLPVLVMLLCAAALGICMAAGDLDVRQILESVKGKPVITFLVFMALFAVKGISGVVLYDVLALMIAAVFPFPLSLITLLAGTAVSVSISYLIGLRTNTESLDALLKKNPKIAKYLDLAKEYGAVAGVLLHMLGLNMEVLGVLFGAMRQKFGVYLLTTLLGLAPCMLSMLVIGAEPDIHTVKFWLMIAVYLLCALAALLYARSLSRKRKSAADRQAEEADN